MVINDTLFSKKIWISILYFYFKIIYLSNILMAL